MKKLLLLLLCVPLLFSCVESTNKNKSKSTSNEYSGIMDCSSACDCADKLVVIAEDIREIEKRLWAKNLTKEEEIEIELEVIKFCENLGIEYSLLLGRVIEKYSSDISDCESVKNMKGTITQMGTDDKDGNSTLYYYDGYVKEDSSGNKTYFLHDGTLITRIEK